MLAISMAQGFLWNLVGNLKSRLSQDAAHIVILSLQGVKSNYLVYAEDADKNHDVEALVIDTYTLYI